MSKQKQWSEMKLKIDGSYVNGTDIGHPDGEGIFYACCCGSIAGSTPKEREHYARLMVAAPEMYELLGKIRNHIDGTCRECESKAIIPEIDALLDKIEEGGE